MSQIIARLEGVHLAFGPVTVLEDVDLTIRDDDFLAIIGPNGGGKSVLLKVLLGLLEPNRGSVTLFGTRPCRSRGRVGYVPQHAGFDRDYPVSVREVVAMARLGHLFKRLGSEDCRVVDEALERVHMVELADRQIGQLSGGQLQRVLIARALAVEPRLLVLDEPTASLDPRIGVGVYDLLQDLQKQMAIVLVTHDVGVVSRYVKTIGCLNRRLFYHDSREITREMIEESYACPVDFVVHQHVHRVLEPHDAE